MDTYNTSRTTIFYITKCDVFAVFGMAIGPCIKIKKIIFTSSGGTNGAKTKLSR